MKSVQAKMAFAAALLLALWGTGAYAEQEESDASDYQNQIGLPDPPADAAENDAEKGTGQNEDILDRALEPFDHAVSDVNRTINKEGDGKASDP